MKIMPTYVHGIMDYIIGVVLLVAPTLFAFPEGPASYTAWAIGIIILLQGIMTRFELSLFPVIPMRMHLGMDYVIGILLAVSPWLFGFADRPPRVWVPHVIVGLLVLGQAMITDPTPRSTPTSRLA